MATGTLFASHTSRKKDVYVYTTRQSKTW